MWAYASWAAVVTSTSDPFAYPIGPSGSELLENGRPELQFLVACSPRGKAIDRLVRERPAEGVVALERVAVAAGARRGERPRRRHLDDAAVARRAREKGRGVRVRSEERRVG